MDHCIFIIIIIIDSHMIIVTVTLSSSAPRTFGVNRGCMELLAVWIIASSSSTSSHHHHHYRHSHHHHLQNRARLGLIEVAWSCKRQHSTHLGMRAFIALLSTLQVGRLILNWELYQLSALTLFCIQYTYIYKFL